LKKLNNILFLILCFHFCNGQLNIDSSGVNLPLTKDNLPIGNASFVFTDSTRLNNPDKILPGQWITYNSLKLKKFIPAGFISKTIYLKFTLRNNAEITDTVYFYPGNSFSNITVFKMQPAGGLEKLKDESKANGFQPLQMLPKQTATFIAELHFTKRKFNSLSPEIVPKKELDKYLKNFHLASYNELIVGYILCGLLLMMIFFNAANYNLGRKKEFLYNCLYAICMFLLIFLNTYIDRRSGVFASFFMGYMAFALLLTGTIFYIAFTRKFLDTKNNYPLLNKLFYYEEKVLLVVFICYSFIYFFTNNFTLQDMLENSSKILILVIGIIYIVVGIKQKNRLFNYLAIGNAILILFSVVSFALILFMVRKSGIFTSALLYYEAGIVGELIFFLLGLTYKNRKELIERIKEQEALKLEAEKQIFETKIAVLNAQQEERNRISTDMHDDLGAGVTAIRLFSELAKKRLGKETVPEIEKISSSSNELLNNMNAIIWTMNSNNDSFSNMVAYIRSYALEYFENTGINCSVAIAEDLPDIAVNGAIRRNVFLVVKEALNNVLKHSKASEVMLVLKKDDATIFLLIQDNGTGIDFENLRRFGNGLKNMKDRMKKSGIGFSIENKNGTLVTLQRNING
jgi:signal transduction histidine kinase